MVFHVDAGILKPSVELNTSSSAEPVASKTMIAELSYMCVFGVVSPELSASLECPIVNPTARPAKKPITRTMVDMVINMCLLFFIVCYPLALPINISELDKPHSRQSFI